jgi:hypothetical protein
MVRAHSPEHALVCGEAGPVVDVGCDVLNHGQWGLFIFMSLLIVC